MENYQYAPQTGKKVGFIIGMIASSIGMIVLFLIGYVGYILLSYYRIGNVDLAVDRGVNTKNVINVGDELSAMTYNIGFGAYSQNYTFFLDTGYDKDGNLNCGVQSTAASYDEAMFNTKGAIKTIEDQNVDFVMMQEVDINSTRSYRINQDAMAIDHLRAYDHVFSTNFHSAFLPYPLYDMHGDVLAGLASFSKYNVAEEKAHRVSYTISDDLSKLFDLDRCFSWYKVSVSNGKYLYVLNSHMSAYDKGGKIRAKQLKELDDILEVAKANGDYLILGGDFNHDLLTYNPNFKNADDTFKYTVENRPFDVGLKAPDWVSYFFKEDGSSSLVDGYKVYASDNLPTCRNNSTAWKYGSTFTITIDGFICSDNIEVLTTETIATNNGNLGTDYFAYSDHQPVKMTFKLKA